MFGSTKRTLTTADDALTGRSTPLPDILDRHEVLGTSMLGPWPAGTQVLYAAMGCFWGAERIFWKLPGVVTTAVGYTGGYTPNATYEEVCSGRTGHAEVVRVVFDPAVIPFDALLRVFWESHDPTQGMRQGNDVGTQYRSAIYCYGAAQRAAAEVSCKLYEAVLIAAGHDPITTEIADAPEFYYAEAYHQQYLAKNPLGYCGLGGTGVRCPGSSSQEQ